MPSGRSGTSERYLYERLPEKRFQQLVSAVLALHHRDVTCFPVGQKDGGRDAVVKRENKPFLIYQVKWAKDPVKNPVAWLTATINEERDNIKRLVADGAQSYVLVTCIAGTSGRSTGSMDQLDRKFAEYSQEFGIPMSVWWRADLDARVDSAPQELIWSYSEMLAGQDAVRYVIEADKIAAEQQTLRALLLQLIATQWRRTRRSSSGRWSWTPTTCWTYLLMWKPSVSRSLSRMTSGHVNGFTTLAGSTAQLHRASRRLGLHSPGDLSPPVLTQQPSWVGRPNIYSTPLSR